MQAVPILRYHDGAFREEQDRVIREEPLEIWGQGRCLGSLVRLPGQDAELILGWCLSEGLISCREDLLDMQTSTEGELTRVDISLYRDLPDQGGGPEQIHNRTLAAESNGPARVRTGQTVTLETLFQVREILEAGQELFQATGGTHCAALFAQGPRLMAMAEDVGRHNALDKVVGRTLGQELEDSTVLVLSSRLNSEMVGKSVRAGIPLLAGVSAPTQRGVSLAEQAGMTLIGFLRPGRLNVYTHAWRLVRQGSP